MGKDWHTRNGSKLQVRSCLEVLVFVIAIYISVQTGPRRNIRTTGNSQIMLQPFCK